MAAVDRALRQGADGVEVDVRLTADGVPVCHHDPVLSRTAGDPRPVSAVDHADLPWIGSHRVPRLSEVLDLVAGRGRLVVELKAPHGPELTGPATVEAVLRVLRRHDLTRVTVSSFDRPCLLALRRAALPVATGLLGSPGVPFDLLLRRAVQDGHVEVHPHVSSVLGRLDLVATARRFGLRVTAWTVDAADELHELGAAGVHAAICDDPREARAALRHRQLTPA